MAYSARAVSLFVAFQAFASAVAALRFETLLAREPETNATCRPDYVWPNNARGRTPCQVAAEVIAPCHGGSWKIRDLPANSKYDRPEGNEAEQCSCSWAAYNLISACADCQVGPQAIRVWPDYIQGCSQALTDDSYYPSNMPNAGDLSIPFWATTNPTTWPGSTWTRTEARSIADQGHRDVAGPQSTSSKKSSSGPIAGGVIGGLVVILGAATVAFFLLKLHRRKIAIAHGAVPDKYGHSRSPSDATDKSAISMSYTNLTSSPGIPTGHTPTIRTHDTSSYPFSIFGSPERFSAPIPTSPSPPIHSRNGSGTSAENHISPFHLPLHGTGSGPSSTDRKAPLGVPRYDSPDAPPTRAEDALVSTSQRGRINPPAYTPHDNSPSPPPAGMRASRAHAKNGSADTHRTQTSISAGPSRQTAHLRGYSADNNSDIITTPMDALSGVPEGTTITRSGADSSYPKDVKVRPPRDSINGRDLA